MNEENKYPGYVPEDDPDFGPAATGPESSGLSPDAAAAVDDEDRASFRRGPENPVVKLLRMIGYYNPKTRKTAIFFVLAVTGLILLLLANAVGEYRKATKTKESELMAQAQSTSVTQGIAQGSSGDNLQDESLSKFDPRRSNNKPGSFAQRMFAQEEGYDEEGEIDAEEFGITAENVDREEDPVKYRTHAEAAEARRRENLSAMGLDPDAPRPSEVQDVPQVPAQSAPQPKPRPSAAPAKASGSQSVAEKYGISEEAIKQAGLTPEQCETLMQGFGESPKTVNELLALGEQEAARQAAAQTPQGADADTNQASVGEHVTAIRKSTSIHSLDSDTWGTLGGMSSLDDDDPFVSDDDDHPFKVMFCRNEKIRSGQRVSLRLLEDMVVDNTLLQANTHLQAICTVGERLSITVPSIEINGKIYSLDFVGYDNDGGFGLYCPQTNASRNADNAKRQAGTIASSSLISAVGGVAGRVVSSGASMVLSNRGDATVTITSGYTFFLIRKRH